MDNKTCEVIKTSKMYSTTKVIEGKNTYVTVRTTAHENGEIQGQILPTNIHVSCLSSMRFACPPTTTPAASNFGP
jgi:hypothetical protein